MSFKVLVVDDEPLGRQRVISLLKQEEDMELVGECRNGPEAVEAMKKEMPDLLFLDIQMPEMNGFEVLRKIEGERIPVVIFVTAFDQHALKAFEAHALDYLLKPFKQERFREAVQRARELLETRQAGAASRKLLALLGEEKTETALSRIAIKTDGRTVFVKTEVIDWIESAGNYLVLHVGKESHVLRESLTALEASLSPSQFLRINRSTIVNLNRVRELQPAFNGEHTILLQDGKSLPVTRKIREVERALKYS